MSEEMAVRNILLVRFGEVHLKGLNRPEFMQKLVGCVRNAAKPYQGHVWLSGGRIYISGMTDADACAEKVANVFGVHSVSHAVEMDKEDFGAILSQAEKMAEHFHGTFKVNARRTDKGYRYNSLEICALAGGYIKDKRPDLAVDVHRPDHRLEIEIREKALLSVGRIEGAGGMPMGTNGKACLLLSGGIDSPVAGYMVARRGVTLTAVYFHSFPYTSERAKEKVIELARILSETCGRITLHIAPFTELQMQIRQKCPEAYGTLIMRRQMMRIAEKIAEKEGAMALVTGESIGQVASQTMEALVCTEEAVRMIVLRPLIGFDKLNIIEKAEKIGTFQTSSLPYEDCCTLFTPKHPVTKPRLNKVLEAEATLLPELDAMIADSVQNAEKVTVRNGIVLET